MKYEHSKCIWNPTEERRSWVIEIEKWQELYICSWFLCQKVLLQWFYMFSLVDIFCRNKDWCDGMIIWLNDENY